jgi:hypothetical protein
VKARRDAVEAEAPGGIGFGDAAAGHDGDAGGGSAGRGVDDGAVAGAGGRFPAAAHAAARPMAASPAPRRTLKP